PRVQEDVRERTAAEAVPGREEVPALLWRDPVDSAAQPWLEGHVLPGLEEERVEAEHAELPVARPRLALAQPLERADVDEDRPGAAELDVVGRRVLEDQAGADRATHELELEEGSVAQHPERPLVRVGDDRDDVVLEHGRDLAVEGARHLADAVRLARADELAFALQLREERRGGERPPVLEPVRAQDPEDAPVSGEDPAVRVAERSGLEAGEGGVSLAHRPRRAVSSASLRPRASRCGGTGGAASSRPLP